MAKTSIQWDSLTVLVICLRQVVRAFTAQIIEETEHEYPSHSFPCMWLYREFCSIAPYSLLCHCLKVDPYFLTLRTQQTRMHSADRRSTVFYDMTLSQKYKQTMGRETAMLVPHGYAPSRLVSLCTHGMPPPWW